MGFVKTLVFLSNLIFVLAGVALSGLGVLVYLGLSETKNAATGTLNVLTFIVIAVGVIIFIISFFGCCGAIKESSCMLTTYSVFMLILAVLSLAVAIAFFVTHGYFAKAVIKEMNDITNPNQPTILHTLETSFKCCGTNGVQYYASGNIPVSCCDTSVCTTTNAYPIGCVEAFDNKISKYSVTIGAVLCVVACVELLASVLGCYLRREVQLSTKY